MRILAAMLGLLAFALTGALAGGLAAPAHAQETRVGEDGFVSPPATIENMEWLVGQWSGAGIAGAPSYESWLPAASVTMVGTFVQENEEGDIMFTEHMYLTDEGGTLVLRIKHFNADLTGWEEKDDMLTFRLVAIEPCAAYFNALTLRCADPDNPGSGIVAAVRMKSDTPEPQELVFRFDRMGAPGENGEGVCPDAMTTLDMNQCFAGRLSAADDRRAQYFAAAIDRETVSADVSAQMSDAESADTAVIAQMRASEAAFDAYRDAECGAVWESWKSGTIRTVMALGCKIELTNRRTHTIWQNWLTYMDSTPPVLPEPGPMK